MNEIKNKNLKLYPKYRQLAMDFLFFYTINVLFLTQVKHIDMSSVVLVDTFYELFVVILQIPATLIINKIGRKKGMILGNTCNAIYLILLMNSVNLFSLICAELACALGFSLKDISEPGILNESIHKDKEEKEKIFAKIQSKAVSGYYFLSAISMAVSGFLFKINGYIPITLSLIIVLITLVLSTRFKDVEVSSQNESENNDEVSLKEAVKFAFDSKRCRSLLLFSALFYGVISVLSIYEISLLEDLNISPEIIGILFAILNLVSSISSKKEESFQSKFKNRTLTVLGILVSSGCIISGCVALLNINICMILAVIILMYIIKYLMVGLYNVLFIKYLSNFTNKTIDTKIFGINSFLSCVCGALFGIFASGLVAIMPTAKAMIIFGWGAFIIIGIILIYMKDKTGLKPEEYSELELKYENRDM